MLSNREKFMVEKAEINVLILGSYGKCEPSLRSLQTHLIAKGFLTSKLVIDFQMIHLIPI